MKKLAVRALLVALVLVAPLFVHGSLVFVPFFVLLNWLMNALFYHNHYAARLSSAQVAIMVFWFFAVPFLVAAWFRFNDRLRSDASVIARRSSRIFINLILFGFSFAALFLSLGISEGMGGPIIIWGTSILVPPDPIAAFSECALALAVLEQACYWLERRCKFLQ